MPRGRKGRSRKVKKARKAKRTKKTTTLVVYQPKQTGGNQPKSYPKFDKNNAREIFNNRRVQMGGSNINQELAHRVCSVSDPFCRAAEGAKWPDVTGSQASIVLQARATTMITTNASGAAALLFLPAGIVSDTGYFYKVLTCTAGSADTGQSPNAGSSTYASAIASVAQVRVVSAGINWWYVGAMTGTGGVTTGTELSGMTAYTAAGAWSVSEPQLSQKVAVYDMRSEGTWVSKATQIDAYTFKNQSSSNLYDNRTCLILGFWGPVSSSVVAVDMVVNVEITLEAKTLMSLMMKPPSPNPIDRKVNETATQLEAMLETFVHGGKDVMKMNIHETARRAIDGLFGAGMKMLGSYMGGPMGGMAAGMISDMIRPKMIGMGPRLRVPMLKNGKM